MFPYTPRKEDELELRKGEMFLVLERCQDGWFKGTSMHTGKIGVFPGNYMSPVSRSVITSRTVICHCQHTVLSLAWFHIYLYKMHSHRLIIIIDIDKNTSELWLHQYIFSGIKASYWSDSYSCLLPSGLPRGAHSPKYPWVCALRLGEGSPSSAPLLLPSGPLFQVLTSTNPSQCAPVPYLPTPSLQLWSQQLKQPQVNSQKSLCTSAPRWLWIRLAMRSEQVNLLSGK